jgi:apolipoprotein D and lipocalin family protein
MKLFQLSGLLGVILFAAIQTYAMGTPPPTVNSVDLNAYVGEWYEQRRLSNSFQDNLPLAGYGVCQNTKATYVVLGKDKLSVTNTCYRFDDSGKSQEETAHAKARVVAGSNNAKLKVNFTGIALLEFLGIGDGDYWILDLGPVVDGKYAWVLVGHPDLKFGWVLARDRQLTESKVEKIVEKAVSFGYLKGQFKKFLQ